MQADGMRPDTWTYSKLLNVAVDLRRFDRVKQYSDDMVKAGVQPDGVLYNHLVGVLAANKYEEDALKVLFTLPLFFRSPRSPVGADIRSDGRGG